MRSAKLRALLELRDIVDKFVFITYEELVSLPQTVGTFLETRFGLQRRTERINLGKKHTPRPHEPLEERHVAHVKNTSTRSWNGSWAACSKSRTAHSAVPQRGVPSGNNIWI